MDKDIVADPEATIIGKEGKKSNLIVYDHAGPDKADVEINEEKVKKGDSVEIIYVFVFNVDKFNKEEDKICSQIRHHKMCVESYGKEEKNRKYKLKVIGTHVSSMDDAKDIENTIYKKTTFKNCGFFELKPKEKETFFKKSLQDKILEYIIKD